MTEFYQVGNVVTLDYNDLTSDVDLTSLIHEAYGFNGIGVLIVKNVPEYIRARKELLPLAYEFAHLDDSIKNKYTHEESFYSFGWSHGKENLQGKPDYSKGSYYANPQYDEPTTDPDLIKNFASFYHQNIWPKEDLPALEEKFKQLGQIIVNVGTLVARQCDRYVHGRCASYKSNSLEEIIRSSLCCKARLLYYFANPLNEQTQHQSESEKSSPKDFKEFSSWCGWHNDHGSLTGLTSAMFLANDGQAVTNPDQNAGLFVRNRKSELIKVNIPEDCIGFQIGETAQVHSGGFLQATPHAVRGSSVPDISRATFAVFMEPNHDYPMRCPDEVPPSNAQSQSAAANLPPGVPQLASRWKVFDDRAQTFGEFSEETHKSYY